MHRGLQADVGRRDPHFLVSRNDVNALKLTGSESDESMSSDVLLQTFVAQSG
jgi:hypothetical protein